MPKELPVSKVTAPPTSYPSDFGVWLRMQRLKAGFTQQQLSDVIGVSQQTVTAWETGRTRTPMMSVASMKRLCIVTSTTLSEIPNGEEDVMFNPRIGDG